MMAIVLQTSMLFGRIMEMRDDLKNEYTKIMNQLEPSLIKLNKIESILKSYKNNKIDLTLEDLKELENTLLMLNAKIQTLNEKAKSLKNQS